jgi:O-antigen ligase
MIAHQHQPGDRTRRAILLLFSLGVFFNGVLLSPELPVVGSKLALSDAFFVPAIFLTLLNFIRFGPPPIPRLHKLILALFGAMILFSAVSYAFIAVPRAAAPVNGAVTLLTFIYGAALLATTLIAVRSYSDVDQVCFAWIAGTFIVTLLSFYAAFWNAPAWAYTGSRINSTMRNVNQMQSFLGPAFILATSYVFSRRANGTIKLVMWAAVGLCAFAMMLTGSRSSLGFLFLLFAVLAIRALISRSLGIGWKFAILSIAGSAVIFGAVLTTAVWQKGAHAVPEGPLREIARPVLLLKKMSEEQSGYRILDPRQEQFLIVKQNWLKSPLFGFGPGAFADRFNYEFEVHNTYLGVLIEQGLAGVLLILAPFAILSWLLAGRWFAEPDPEQKLLILSILLALAIIFLYGLTVYGLRQRVFWITVGLAAVACELRLPGRERTVTPPSRGGLAVSLG